MTVMSRSARRKKKGAGIKSGMAPGTMVFIGEQKRDKARIDVIRYSETELEELRDATVPQCSAFARQPGIVWLNVSSIHDVQLIGDLGKCFDLHPMTMEDIVNST